MNYDLDTLQKLYEVGQNLEEEIGQSAFKITGVEKALMVITAVSLIILALSGLGLIPAAVITGAEIIGGIGSVGELSYKGYQYIDNKNTMARQEKEVQDVKERITDKKAITKPEKDECIPDNTIKNAVTILENSGIKSEEVQYVKLENKEVNKFVDMINKGGTGKGRG